MSAEVHDLLDARSDAGFTLIELLVATTILLIVAVATFSMLQAATSLTHRETERAHAIREGQVGLDRMLRELRHAKRVDAGVSSARVLAVDVVRVGTTTDGIVYDCDEASTVHAGAFRCVRRDGTGAATTLVDGVRNTDVFDVTPTLADARHVRVRLSLAVDGGRDAPYHSSSLLTDGTALRNVAP